MLCCVQEKVSVTVDRGEENTYGIAIAVSVCVCVCVCVCVLCDLCCMLCDV